MLEQKNVCPSQFYAIIKELFIYIGVNGDSVILGLTVPYCQGLNH
jgi:hypothetical protein